MKLVCNYCGAGVVANARGLAVGEPCVSRHPIYIDAPCIGNYVNVEAESDLEESGQLNALLES